MGQSKKHNIKKLPMYLRNVLRIKVLKYECSYKRKKKDNNKKKEKPTGKKN